jgi:nonspecific dipeptidase
VDKLTKHGKAKVLQHRWRYPSLSIHGIEGAWAGEGDKTVIPYKVGVLPLFCIKQNNYVIYSKSLTEQRHYFVQVIGKFSIRLVPDQEPDTIEKLVQQHIESVQTASGSPNAAVYGSIVHTQETVRSRTCLCPFIV